MKKYIILWIHRSHLDLKISRQNWSIEQDFNDLEQAQACIKELRANNVNLVFKLFKLMESPFN